jgi:hypothetical protein
MKLHGDFKGETYFMDDIKEEQPSAKKKENEFAQASSFEVEELSLDLNEEEVQEIRGDSNEKLVRIKRRECLKLHKHFAVLHSTS